MTDPAWIVIDAQLRLRLERYERALGLIVKWEGQARPHRNIPLMDCADVARRALDGKEPV